MAYIRTNLRRVLHIDSIITVHYFEYMKDFIFLGESHDFWEILYVDKGSVFVTAGQTETLLHQGDLIVHQPDEFHALRAPNASPNLVAISFLCNCPVLDSIRNQMYRLSSAERDLVGHIVAAAKDCFLTPFHLPSIEKIELKPERDEVSEQFVLQYLELLLLYLCRKNSPDSDTRERAHAFLHKQADKSGKKPTILAQIESFFQNHICERVTVGQIAAAFSLSDSSLQSLFHREKNCGPMQFFNEMKIERAQEIIRNDDMTFSEIAYYLSFSSPQYFSRRFHECTGMTPSEYQTSVKQIASSIGHSVSAVQRKLEEG